MAEQSPALHSSTNPRTFRIWLIASLIFVFLFALPNLRYPIYRDQATYCLIGQGLLRGQQLYRDLWDNKPPGIFYLYAPVVKILGAAMWSVGVLDILWLLIFSACMFYFARRYLGVAAAVISVIVFAVWHCQGDYIDAAQAESFLILFVFLSYFLLSGGSGRWFQLSSAGAGLAFGAAFWIKYNAVAFLPLLMVLPCLDTSRIDSHPSRLSLTVPRRAWFVKNLIFIGAFAATVLAGLAYFWFAGLWPYLKEVQFEVLPRYATMIVERTPDYGLWALSETTRNLGAWTEAVTLAALIVAWRRRELAGFAPVLFAAIVGYVCTALQARFHSYSFQTCTPFFAMIWGYLAVKTSEGFHVAARRAAERGWKLARVLVWIAWVNVLLVPLPGVVLLEVQHYRALALWWKSPEMDYSDYWWPHPLEHHRDEWRTIQYLKNSSRPGDGLFVWGNEPLLYFLTSLHPPTRFVSDLALVSLWGPARWRKELMVSLEKSPPRFIVVGRDDTAPNISFTDLDSEGYLQCYPALSRFLEDNYRPVETFSSFVIYRHRALSEGRSPS